MNLRRGLRRLIIGPPSIIVPTWEGATMPDFIAQADSFLAGTSLTFNEANALWMELRKLDNLSLARAFLSRLRQGRYLSDGLPAVKGVQDELCAKEAFFTIKSP